MPPAVSLESGEGVVLDERFPGILKPHTYLVLTPAVNDRVLVGNITSIREGVPRSWKIITLTESDHPSVQHPSCFPIHAIKDFSLSKLQRAVQQVGSPTYSRMDHEVHQRILKGILDNKKFNEKAARFLIENFGPEVFRIFANCVFRNST